ncbi:MAG: TIGR00730 family Rossman fold protein [Chlamydiia bacterium]|nr:TIGR00730 family Rossman fold protein [Chlamydiia bacterium]
MPIEDFDVNKKISTTDSWRVFRILSEFVEGFEKMVELGPSVSVFGSARMQSGPYHEIAKQLGEEIVKRGFGVITGGGPGMMEAANFGAQMAKGRSCGLCVDLPHELEPNPYIDREFLLHFRYFFIRKVMFIRYSQGFVFLPGGYGSMDELFEALTLVQTNKLKKFPIYLIGRDYWKGLHQWLEEVVKASGAISAGDLAYMQITDDPIEVAEGIEHYYRQHYEQYHF